MTLDELIVRRDVESAQRPRQNTQAFEAPRGIDLLLLLKPAWRTLQDFPFVRFEFIVNAEQFDPGEQILVLVLLPGQHVPEPGQWVPFRRAEPQVDAALFEDRSRGDGRQCQGAAGGTGSPSFT